MLKRSLVVGLLAANVFMTGCGQKAEEGAKEGSTDTQTEQSVNSDAPPAEEASASEAEVETDDAAPQEEEEEKPAEEKKPEKKSSKKKSKSK